MLTEEMLLAHQTPADAAEIRLPGMLLRMYRTARAAHPGNSPRVWWYVARLLTRQIANRHGLRAWYGGELPALQEVLASRPSLVCAVGRPYMNTRWDASRRLQGIEQHYRQVSGHARALRLVPDVARRLAEVTGREKTVAIVLDSPAWFVHEGEVSLNLFMDGERIYTLAFSLGSEGDALIAYVGALQGLGGDKALTIYRELTHALHGLRPRDLLLAAFRMLCKEVGVRRIFAVNDLCRVSRSSYFREKPDHRSYDAVWEELHGSVRDDGFFELPLEVARRTQTSIPSRKRSEYRHRYEMLDGLEGTLTSQLRMMATS